MRLLLDTHIFLWSIMDDKRLKATARARLSAAQVVYVSAASIWEIAIKSRLGKIEGDARELAAAIDSSGFIELPVRASHAAAVAVLPLLHNDPFDRLLVAQAIVEPLRLLSADETLARYGSLVEII